MHTSFPTREHFVPLLIAPGRGGPDFCHAALRKGAAIRALAAIVLLAARCPPQLLAAAGTRSRFVERSVDPSAWAMRYDRSPLRSSGRENR